MEKEEKDRLADYYKEVLKSKYEYLKVLVWLIIVLTTGIMSLALSNNFELVVLQQISVVLGLLIGICLFIFSLFTITSINNNLNLLKTINEK